MSRILIIPVLCAIVLASGSTSVILADCPNCYRDQPAMTSTETGAGGRPVITLQIAGDWDTSPGSGTTRTNIYDAVQSAVANWNGATGSGGPSPYIIRTGADVQNQPRGSAHVTVVMDPNIRVPTIAGGPGGPYQIKLPPQKKDCDVQSLIQTIEHELAHIFGLDHPSTSNGNVPPTSVCPSVAQASADGTKCNPRIPARGIQASDVDKARGVASGEAFRNANCTIYFKTNPRNEEEPGPTPGPGGYTDPNPYPYYPPTCYYFYYAEDAYTCSTVVFDDGTRETSCSYQGTRYYLEDVICF